MIGTEKQKKQFLTKRELATRWNISITKIDRMRKSGEIADVDATNRKPGPGRRIVRFDLQDVLRWEDQHRSAPTVSQ